MFATQRILTLLKHINQLVPFPIKWPHLYGLQSAEYKRHANKIAKCRTHSHVWHWDRVLLIRHTQERDVALHSDLPCSSLVINTSALKFSTTVGASCSRKNDPFVEHMHRSSCRKCHFILASSEFSVRTFLFSFHGMQKFSLSTQIFSHVHALF